MFYGNTHLHKFTSASGIVPLQLPKDASHPSGIGRISPTLLSGWREFNGLLLDRWTS